MIPNSKVAILYFFLNLDRIVNEVMQTEEWGL